MKTPAERQRHVAEIITDLWPHRMSTVAASSIDDFYMGLRSEIDHIAGQPSKVYVEVALEREDQDAKWGEQNHPIHKSPELAAILNTGLANLWKANNDSRVEEGALAWDGILLEEVYEALAETDPVKQREELVQAGAVIVAMIECLDRRAAE